MIGETLENWTKTSVVVCNIFLRLSWGS